ncbi:MAG: hypothetical protein QNJ40_05735 [Xanthomonadales bacterium]|nr:hypothetical protein [Xanthomonadales bacterium]
MRPFEGKAASVALWMAGSLLLLTASNVMAQWPTGGGGINEDLAVDVVTSGVGDTYVLGYFQGTATFGEHTVNASGLRDIFVAKVSSSGSIEWVIKAGGPSDDMPTSIAVDASDNVYVGGAFYDEMSFGAIDLTSDGMKDGFVAKLSASGQWQWAYRLGGMGDDEVRALASVEGNIADIPPTEGSLFVGGHYFCMADFPGGLGLENDNCLEGEKDLFIARVEHDGDWVWTRDRGGAATGNESVNALDVDSTGRLYFSASFAPGGRVSVLSDSFSNLSQWTESGDTSQAGVRGDPDNRMSSSSMMYLRNGVTVTSSSVDLSASDSATVAFSAYTGGDYRRSQWFTSDQSGWDSCTPVTIFVLFQGNVTRWYCETIYSEYPESSQNENLRAQYKDNQGSWRTLETFSPGSEYARFNREGNNAYVLPPDARHNDFQLRFFMTAGFTGTANCVGPGPNLTESFTIFGFVITFGAPATNEPCDWWHVDNVDIQTVAPPNFFLGEVSNATSDSPGLTEEFLFPDDIRVTDMRRDESGDRIVVSADNLAAPQSFCTDLLPTGAFVASFDAAGAYQCDWVNFPTGSGAAASAGITIDSSGNVYAIGTFVGSIDFEYWPNCIPDGPFPSVETLSTESPTSPSDVMLARYTREGLGCWATGGANFDPSDSIPARAGGIDVDEGRAISTDGVGNLYLVGGFTTSAVFGEDERVNGVGGLDAFIANWGTDGRPFQIDVWPVGVAVTPPINAKVDDFVFVPQFMLNGELVDAISQKLFYWTPPLGTEDARLIPLRPVSNITILWRIQGDQLQDEGRITQIGSANWPVDTCTDSVDQGCYQVHIASAPVEIEPASGDYLLLDHIKPPLGNDAAVDNSVYTANTSGFSTLLYINGPTPDITQFPITTEVVRTLPFASAPQFVDAVPWEIGQAVLDGYHNESGRAGFAINELAFYDGVGTDAAYNRDARTGQIIPVNRSTSARIQDAGKELVVAWYRRKNKGVYWPDKPVRYAPQWPLDPDKIIIASESGGEVLGQQPLDPLVFSNLSLYVQGDPELPGYNPNDEHAIFAPSSTGTGLEAVFALRSDYGSRLAGDVAAASDPYVLVKYQDELAQWRFRVFEVIATGAGFDDFRYSGTAGTPVFPPYPLSILPGCTETLAVGQAFGEAPPPPFFQDYKNQIWAASEGSGEMLFAYPLQPGFFYDLNNDDEQDDIDGDGEPDVDGNCVPWLARLPAEEGGTSSPNVPIKVAYDIIWPTDVPQLVIGETLLTPKRGLPDIFNQASTQVVYDDLYNNLPEAERLPSQTLAQMIDPLNPRFVRLDAVPSSIATELRTDGKLSILGSADGTIKLPVAVRDRISFDPQNGKLTVIGLFDESGAGEPLLLPNVLSKRDRVVLKQLDGGDGTEESGFTNACENASECTWDMAVEALFRLSRNPNRIQKICTNSQLGDENQRECLASDPVTENDVLIGFQDTDGNFVLEPFVATGVKPALTAGNAQGSGFMTLAFNNDPALTPLPISLSVLRVDCLQSPPPPTPPEEADIYSTYQGQIQVLEPENIFDEQLVLRHSGDFGGNPDALEFEWFYKPDLDGTPPMPLPDPDAGQLNGWLKFPVDDAQGAVEITIAGANIQTLSDNWYVARYRGLPACGNASGFSIYAGQPGATPLEPRAQLAEGWVKRVLKRLNPFEARVQNFAQAATNNYASMLIQLGERYEGDIALNNDPENLNSFGLIEAYTTVMRRALTLSVDATPPVDYGPANTAILLVASRLVDFYTLLGNEAYADALDPMIGVDTGGGTFSLAPTIFNFQNQLASILEEELVLLRGRDNSQGPVAANPVYNRLFWNFTTGDGEVAYALSYNISDQNDDGVIDEFDARIQFPQGHGDAWGHYLTAMDIYYDLLRHPFYSWDPRPEAITVAGVPLQVDFLDERQFAETAAAKARVGAEIVDLTYRNQYVEDPAGQFQGYEDSDFDRAWGLSEWGSRAGQGAYFDWIMGNAILPAEDPNPDNVGIQRIERSNIAELDEIIAQYDKIQAQVDEADRGLNPLGLASGVVPFDIDPSQLDDGVTHFEQILTRAETALDNVVQVWDFANQLTQMMRFNQDEVDDIRRDSVSQENDFTNQLIEIFGYPYDDDIGPGGTYPAGYNGPDLYHYMYVDPPALAGTQFDFTASENGYDPSTNNVARIRTFQGVFTPVGNGINFFDVTQQNPAAPSIFLPLCITNPLGQGCALGDLTNNTLEVEYQTIESADFGFAFAKPEAWTGVRRAPGRLQTTLGEVLQARIALRQALVAYDKLRLDIEDAVDGLEAKFNIKEQNIDIAITERNVLLGLTVVNQVAANAAIVARRIGEFSDFSFKAGSECVPKNVIAGLAAGGDIASTARCTVHTAGNVVKLGFDTLADVLDIAGNVADAAKEDVSAIASIQTLINDTTLDLFDAKGEIDALLREEPLQRAEIFARAEAAQQLLGDYNATLAEGLRVLDQLKAFRRRGAEAIQEYRYEDMAFRIFRNDALQKYRAAFDLAARYVYLAAAAYDYDTNLLGSDAQSGQGFLTDIVQERSIGQILDGAPVAGSRGLADPIARMKLNFDVLKGQMGFNNPQNETNRFSLRQELFRITGEPESDDAWRQTLDQARVDNLWNISEFRRFARPFAPESAGPQPGIVLEFQTTVNFGLNFFGKELGPGDSSYDSSQFSTRIRGLGAWFADYAGLPLSNTPRIYLFPVGADVLRAPAPDSFATREWQIIDQVIPVPFAIGSGDLQRFDWLPSVDNVIGSPVELRRYPRFLAYHLSEPFDNSEIVSDSRLIGRSVWNRKWLLIIPGASLLNDPDEGLDTFVNGSLIPGSSERDGNGVSDILIFFQTYAYSGN